MTNENLQTLTDDEKGILFHMLQESYYNCLKEISTGINTGNMEHAKGAQRKAKGYKSIIDKLFSETDIMDIQEQLAAYSIHFSDTVFH